MNKISFPKGSLKFTKIDLKPSNVEKNPLWKNELKNLVSRKKFVDLIEGMYPGTKGVDEGKLPLEVQGALASSKIHLKATRQALKAIPEFQMASNYKISFKHPKWHPIVGVIEIESKRANVKESLEQIAKKFKEAKNNYRILRKREKSHRISSLRSDIKYFVSGGIIYMPEVTEGIFVKFMKDKEKQIVFSPKKPKDNSNYIGIELEFMCIENQNDLGLRLFEAGVGKNVELKQDGSLRCCGTNNQPSSCTEHRGQHLHEINILVKEDNYKEVMQKVCKVLSEVKSVVNKSCGMHVHLDMRTRDAERAYQNLISSQNILFKMNPNSRAEKYAKKSNERDIVAAKGADERYRGINAVSLNKHNTIEIRIHSGTIDYTKITNWVAILVQIANHGKRIVKNYVSLKSFCTEFGIEDEIQSYMEERIKKFQIQEDSASEPDAEQGVA